jgi:hypothetical protein
MPVREQGEVDSTRAIPESCPYCDLLAYTTREEVAHMNACHRDILAERLADAGFVEDADGRWIDTLAEEGI